MTALNVNIEHINTEIDILRIQNPLRNWTPFFDAFNSKIISEYKKIGKFKTMIFAQYTDFSLFRILSYLKNTYSFEGHQFNQRKGMLILRNTSTHEADWIYVGEQDNDMICDACDRLLLRERNRCEQI